MGNYNYFAMRQYPAVSDIAVLKHSTLVQIYKLLVHRCENRYIDLLSNCATLQTN